jgi:hypothetical protein
MMRIIIAIKFLISWYHAKEGICMSWLLYLLYAFTCKYTDVIQSDTYNLRKVYIMGGFWNMTQIMHAMTENI